ncbi:MAG: hypothetical protein ACRECT_02355 [Thermoplasmata archaeon]
MSGSGEPYRSPYGSSPGSSTPSPEITPAEGVSEMWTFFWVTVASMLIITVGGVGAWLYLHH